MILTCPNCDTQYVVKDGAIPPGGRQVRCAACKHSWHQDPEDDGFAEDDGPGHDTAFTDERADPEPQPVSGEEPAAEDLGNDDDESLAEATLIAPRSGVEAEERAFEEAVIENAEARDGPAEASVVEQTEPADWREPPQAEAEDDEFSPFPATAEREPRGRSPLLTILIVVLLVVALAAAFWFLAPADLKAKLGLGAAGATPLALVTTHMDRQRLASGNETLTINGRVINPTGKAQAVPPLQAQLKSRTGKVVYSWTIAPPARSLPAGASASFYSTEVDVPAGGDELTITLGAQES